MVEEAVQFSGVSPPGPGRLSGSCRGGGDPLVVGFGPVRQPASLWTRRDFLGTRSV